MINQSQFAAISLLERKDKERIEFFYIDVL